MNQSEQIQYLNHTLLDEMPEYKGQAAQFPPFILTVDRLGWVCYLLTAIHSH